MCGIAGMVNRNGSPERSRLEDAAAALAHRGPDGQGLFTRRNVGLVHTRLSIIDLEGGQQPLHSADGQHHLVANGEIYNYPGIRQQHLGSGKESLTASDSEAILQVYAEYGAEGFSRLRGMFAFALYDEQQQTLFLARDRLGIKPLYYAETSQGVVFASEIKGLLPLLDAQPDINPDALSSFLNYQFSTGRNTIFRSIKRVLPGEYLKLDNKAGITHHQYWSATSVKPVKISLEEAAEAFEPLFDEVMREHLCSDVPLGLFLSGGIDSSVLLAKLGDIYDAPLRTYSIGYQDADDELSQADALAQQFGTGHTSITATRDELFERIVPMTWATDDLMRDYACLPMCLLSETAAQDLKVVFSGEGGDEAFAGYRRYAPSFESKLKTWVFGSGGIKTRGQWHAKSLPRSALGDAIRQTQPRTAFKTVWSEAPDSWSAMQKAQYVDLTTSLPDNLFVKADRIMMASGLEGRVPFSDHRLVEFGLSLPDSVKYPQRRGKVLIRQWAEKVLPREHLQKPKRGFYVPVKEWLAGDFLDQLDDKLRHNTAIQEWFVAEKTQALFAAHKAGKNYSREIWGLMQFAIWHRLFVEGADTPSKQENPLDWL